MDKNALIQNALEAMPNFLLVDENGIIVYMNKVYANLLGMPLTRIIGQKVTDIIPNTKMMEVLKSGKSETGDIMSMYNHSLRQNVDLVCNRIPLFENGQIIGAAAMTTFEKISDIGHLYSELDRIKKENEYYKETIKQLQDNPLHRIIGSSPSMLEIKNTIADFAQSNLAILLTGETGVGKEVFASAIHGLSNRKLNHFVKINCAAIPKDLLESELFGYEEGAFTGAKKSGKIGKFELANEGTLLLDEIGEMPLDLQSKLLRVLQEKEIEPLGSTKTKKVNVRIICSTNQDVQELIRKGKFREDVYYRINTIELTIPPLRERISDIPSLCEFFIGKQNEENGTHTTGIDPDVIELLQNYAWPGNVRELEHTIERLSYLNPNGNITLKHCDFLIKKVGKAAAAHIPSDNDLHMNRNLTEIETIQNALKRADGNKTKAAKLLGISRSMLYNKLKQYQIS